MPQLFHGFVILLMICYAPVIIRSGCPCSTFYMCEVNYPNGTCYCTHCASTTTTPPNTQLGTSATIESSTTESFSTTESSSTTESTSTTEFSSTTTGPQIWDFSRVNITEYACSQLCLPYQACFNYTNSSCICYNNCLNYSTILDKYPPAKTCKELYYDKGVRMSGIYVIEPDPGHLLTVECDLEGRDLCSGSLVYGMSGAFSSLILYNWDFNPTRKDPLLLSPYDQMQNYLILTNEWWRDKRYDSIVVSFSNYALINGISLLSEGNVTSVTVKITGTYDNGSSSWNSGRFVQGSKSFTTVQMVTIEGTQKLSAGVRQYIPLRAFAANSVTLRFSIDMNLKIDFHGCFYDPSAEKYIDHSAQKGRYYLPISNASSLAWGDSSNPNLFDSIIYNKATGPPLKFHFYDIPLGKVVNATDCDSQPLSCNFILQFTNATEQCNVTSLQTNIYNIYSQYLSNSFNTTIDCLSKYYSVFQSSIVPKLNAYYASCPRNATQFLEDQKTYYYSKARSSCIQTISTPLPYSVSTSFADLCSTNCNKTDDINYISVPIVWINASYKCDFISYIKTANSPNNFIYDVGPYADSNQTVFSVGSTYRIACKCPYNGTNDFQCQPDFTTYANNLTCYGGNFTCLESLVPSYDSSTASKSGSVYPFNVGDRVAYSCKNSTYTFNGIYDVNIVVFNCTCNSTWSGFYSNSSAAIWKSSYDMNMNYSCSQLDIAYQ